LQAQSKKEHGAREEKERKKAKALSEIEKSVNLQ
jgi:hypothetical protein